MTEPAQLEPLVTEAHAQYAACQVRLEAVERIASSYPSMLPLPEELEQRLREARSAARDYRAAWLRLKSKLDTDPGVTPPD